MNTMIIQPKISDIKMPFFDDRFIDIIDNISLLSLFRHDVLPPHIRSDILSKIHNVSLIISHCDHPLTWVSNFTSGFENITNKVWIFTKCGKEVIDAPQNAEIFELPNVGRCDHTYAYWMSNYFYKNYSNPLDSPYEIFVFMKDTDYMFDTKKSLGRKFEDIIALAVTNGLGCMMTDIAPWNLHKYSILRKYELGARYKRAEGEDLGEPVSFHNDKLENLGKWVDQLQLYPTASTQDIVSVCYGGVWAATGSQIAEQPKKVWEAIEESLSRGDNIAEGHYAERMWAALLSKPLSNKSATAVWEANPTVHEIPTYLVGTLTPLGIIRPT